ncbi:MAG: Uma2 family endonuclease [Blastocatellia bacterium]
MATPIPRRRFTVEEYHRMAEAGILAPEERIELIEGEVIEMAAIGPRHAMCVDRIDEVIREKLGRIIHLRAQNPIRLSNITEPQPDITLAKRADYSTHHPTGDDVLLAIEVSDTTLEKDRTLKQKVYANASVPEFWIVNLPDDVIEIYRNPAGDVYSDVQCILRDGTLSPHLLPTLILSAEEILG